MVVVVTRTIVIWRRTTATTTITTMTMMTMMIKMTTTAMLMMSMLTGTVREFVQFTYCAVSDTHTHVAKTRSYANYVQHIGLFSRAACVPRSAKGLLSYLVWQSGLVKLK